MSEPILFQGVALDETCPRCDGTGFGVEAGGCRRDSYRCGFCLGNGFVPTEEGERLLDFMTRHVRSRENGKICAVFTNRAIDD